MHASAQARSGPVSDGTRRPGSLRRRPGLSRPAADGPEPGQVPGLLRRHGRGRARGPGRPGDPPGLFGQADEDSTGPDRLEIIRRSWLRQGFALWLELGFEGPNALPGLPPPDSAEALRRGLVRLDSQGRADGPAYHPLHPEVREAMKRRVTKALAELKAGEPGSAGGGLVIRLGPGPTLLGTPDTGLDDATYRRFIHETFSPETTRGIPGLESTDPGPIRRAIALLAGVGRMPWLTWRSKEIAALYAELNAAVHAVAPAARLAVVTPGLDGGPAGSEARRVDRAGLPPSQAWRSVGLDLQAWPSGPDSPLVLRGMALSTDALSHDLATSPDLDALVAARPHRGLLLSIDGEGPHGTSSTARRPTPAQPRAERSSRTLGGFLAAEPERSGTARRRLAGPQHRSARREPAGLADRAAAGRRPGRRRAAGPRTRRPGCAVGLPRRKGRCGPGRTAAPLCPRALRPSGEGGARRRSRPMPLPSRSASWCEV